MIDITLLGTAALLPLPDRALTSAFLACGGHSILFDCGEGTQTAARRWGVNVLHTDAIAITHYHGDHIFGLPGLLQSMQSMERTEPLYIFGPGDAREALEPLLRAAGYPGFPVRVADLPARLCDLMPGWPAGAALTAFPTHHRVISQGYAFTLSRAGRFSRERAEALGIPMAIWGRLQRGETIELDGRVFRPTDVLGEPRRGLKIVFSGDTALCPALTEAAGDADLFLCEATYGEDDQEDLARQWGHMTFAHAAQTALDAKARRLWLMHFSQRMENPQDFLPNARRVYPDAVCGQDGLRLSLAFDDE